MPSHSKTLFHGLLQTNCLAMSAQNWSGFLSNRARSACQFFTSAWSQTIAGAAYSSTLDFTASGASESFVVVPIGRLLYEFANLHWTQRMKNKIRPALDRPRPGNY